MGPESLSAMPEGWNSARRRAHFSPLRARLPWLSTHTATKHRMRNVCSPHSPCFGRLSLSLSLLSQGALFLKGLWKFLRACCNGQTAKPVDRLTTVHLESLFKFGKKIKIVQFMGILFVVMMRSMRRWLSPQRVFKAARWNPAAACFDSAPILSSARHSTAVSGVTWYCIVHWMRLHTFHSALASSSLTAFCWLWLETLARAKSVQLKLTARWR